MEKIVRHLSQAQKRNSYPWPLGYFLVRSWLQNFVYRTQITPHIFLLWAVFAVVSALMTLSLQTLRAARANPAESLRYE